MQKLTRAYFILYLSLFFFLNSALALYEGPEIKDENDTNPIEELYYEVTPDYMKYVIGNMSSFLENMVFYDIIKNPPSPYNDYKLNITQEFEKININETRPFYEFYRDVKKTLSNFHDANFDILGDKLPGNINFSYYNYCLPFQFYLDYEENQEVYMYIKDFPECSKYYNDSSLIDKINALEKVPVLEINGQNAFDFVQEFGREFYKYKNPDSDFSINIEIIHNNHLAFIPLSLEELNHINVSFNNGETLETKYHIIKEAEELQEKIEEKNEANITWDYSTENGEFKCREDHSNQLNVLVIKSFFYERVLPSIIYRCAKLIYSNSYKTVIITSQLWNEENTRSYLYLQLLFPKMNGKYNMAMKQTYLNEQLFEKDPSIFLDPKTCRPFNSWEDFIEPNGDDYGEGVFHNRTKIFNPIKTEYLDEMNDIRRELIGLGHLKKSTEIIVLTDTVNYGPASTFIKTIQNNGGAIEASYSGNPYLNKSNITTLDASLDPAISTNYEELSDYARDLNDLGFSAYEIPYAEAFENIEVTKGDIPMAYKVNKVDEITNIYHCYDDSYYDEFIKEAQRIFTEYNDNQKCNKDNMNLVYESNDCVFDEDKFSHGGYKCGDDERWSRECKKTYCDFGYFYNKLTGNCEIDTCIVNEIIDINEETEKTIEIDPTKRYIVNLNTNIYAYFFKSDADDIIAYSDLSKCSRFCAVKTDVDFMYLNYGRNLTSPANVTIISKKVDIYMESYKFDSPDFSQYLPMGGKMIFIFQLTDDNNVYIDSFDKSSRFYYARYDDNMTPDDIINRNDKYFKEGLDQFLYLPKDGIYIGYFEQELGFPKIYIYNKHPENIKMELTKIIKPTILFLSKDVDKYQIDFAGNDLPIAIRLNEKTNATFDIKVSGSSETKTINLTDKYFIPSTLAFNETIEISNIKASPDGFGREGALIEILFSLGDEYTEIIHEEVTDYVLTQQMNLIEFNPPENKNIIQISIKSNESFYISAYGGLSKESYFYPALYPVRIESNYTIKLDDPLKDLVLEKDEKYYISLNLYVSKEEGQEVKLTVKYYNNPIEDLYEIINETYAKEVISNLIAIIENNYVYNDIVKNPPEPEGLENYVHKPINYSQALSGIETANRQFYDFYRDLREALGVPRDLHFRIYGMNTPSGIKFHYMGACLPFSFHVLKENDEAKMYIKYFPDCGVYFSREIREYVQKKAENKTYLKSINGQDPFDYIQNWGRKYKGNKSPHAHFTYMKTLVHAFDINLYPYKPEELKMNFTFEGEDEPLKLDYHIYLPNFREMNNLLGANILSETEFDEFYEKEMKKHIQDVNVPNIFDMVKKYKKTKGIKVEEEKEENGIQWDYKTPDENILKCRVDEINKLNVLVQGSFMFDMNLAEEILTNCTTLFHSNNYPVVVIQNRNGGGYGQISIALAQILQVKILTRDYLSYKPLEFLREGYEQAPETFLNVDTCRPYPSFDDFLNGTVDEYTNGDKIIYHKKSKIIDLLDLNLRK